jgi:hypothetical protein
MRKIAIIVLSAVFLLVPLSSVSAANSQSQTVVVNVNSAPQITTYALANGKVFTDQNSVVKEIAKSFVGKSNLTIVMNVHTFATAQKITGKTPGKLIAAAGWGFGFPVGNYYVRISLEPGPLGGCIGKNVWHVGLMISKQGSSTPLIDLHLAAWRDNGGPQFGAYNSGSVAGFCIRSAFNYSAVYNSIFKASSALMGAVAGYVVANLSAPATYGELGALL